jgi:hypothetical protein
MDFLRRATGLFKNIESRLDSYNEKTFRWFVLLVYVLFATMNIITHEMWRDELQPWVMAVSSNSLSELFFNIRYEGHPPLWYLMLYALSRATQSFAAMQALHLAIALAVAYVFLRFAPFTRLQRLLFVFGYFPLYEYAAISRGYAIGILLLFCLCVVMQKGGRWKYIACGVILFLLSFTTVYGFIITIAFFTVFVLKYAADREMRIHKWQMALCAIMVPAGLFVSAYITIPKGQTRCKPFVTGFNEMRAPKALASPWKAFCPIPQQKITFWNSNIVRSKGLLVILGPLVLYLSFLLLARNRDVLLLFFISVFLMLGFQYSKYPGSMRHHGHYYMMFIACLWLCTFYGSQWQPAKLFRGVADTGSKIAPVFWGVLLTVQAVAGIEASVMEWGFTFSQSKNTAAYLVTNGFAGLPMIGDEDTATSSVAMRMHRDIYYPAVDSMGSFVVFSTQNFRKTDERMVVEKAREMSDAEHSDVVLILSYPLRQYADSTVKLAQFDNAIVKSENFYLYLLKYQRQPSGTAYILMEKQSPGQAGQ